MLKKYSYFSLIGGYKNIFINKSAKKYKRGVTFEDISEELNQKANNVKLAFGSQFDDDLLNSINWTNEEADDIDQPIFNLQGVQVKNPEKGIYIRGGKKYLVK